MSRARVLLATALLVSACSSGGDDAQPSPTTDAVTSTTAVDRSGVVLAGVEGETTTTILDVGRARLVGTVTGPQGSVTGATVRIERYVDGHTIRHHVVTAVDGRFELTGVPGGRYRLRAFQAPNLAQTSAEVRFLTDGDEHTFDLVVEDQRGLVVHADAAPDLLVEGDPVNVVVLVATRTVDADGIVRSRPVAGVDVVLTGLGRWVLRDDVSASTEAGATTSASGIARFELRCVQAGDPGLVLEVPVEVVPDPVDPSASTTSTTAAPSAVERVSLELPACARRAATSSTTDTTDPITTEP